jgi:hypothetical protein
LPHTRNSAYKVLAVVRVIRGSPLVGEGRAAVVGLPLLAVLRLGLSILLLRGLLVWEDLGCGGGCRLSDRFLGLLCDGVLVWIWIVVGSWLLGLYFDVLYYIVLAG